MLRALSCRPGLVPKAGRPESPWLMGGAVTVILLLVGKTTRGELALWVFSLSTFLMKCKLFLFYYKADLCPSGVGGIEQNMGGFLSVQNLGWGLGLKEPFLVSIGGYGEAWKAFVFVCARRVEGAASIFFTMPSEVRGMEAW